MQRAFIAENTFQLGKVGKPIDPEQWGMTPQTINAYYNPVRNEIVFPAAILQPPFFDLDGGRRRELRRHRRRHRPRDGPWLRRPGAPLRCHRARCATGGRKQDEAEYQKRAKVLVEQFNQFEPLPGLHVNGELTLGENIADLTGLVIAHRAYQLSLKGAPAPVIDGLTADQRFYMGWAQSWMAKKRDDSLRQQVLTNVHSPEMYRANGPLRNMPEFYAAFGVKDGDKLFLPADRRVKIW